MVKKNQGNMEPFSKKELAQLYSTYNPDPKKDTYNSGKFNPLTRNLRTDTPLGLTHHCQICKGAMSASCFVNLHYAFCSTWVNVWMIEDNERVLRRVRCGERFQVLSNGCGKHSKTWGHNKGFIDAEKSGQCDPNDFKDPNPQGTGEAEEDEDNIALENEMWALYETMVANDEEIPYNFFFEFWQANRKGKEADVLATGELQDKKVSKSARRAKAHTKSYQVTEERNSFSKNRGNKPPKAKMEVPRQQLQSSDESKAPGTARERVLNTLENLRNPQGKGKSTKK